jgi:TonB family protein
MIPALVRACPAERVAALLIALTTPLADAQSTAPQAPAPAPDSAQAISERVRRDAERPYYWIRVNSQKAAPAPAANARGNHRPRTEDTASTEPSQAAGRGATASGTAATNAPGPAAAAVAAPASPRLTTTAAQTLLDDAPSGAGRPAVPGALSTSLADPVAPIDPSSVVRPATAPDLPAATPFVPATPSTSAALAISEPMADPAKPSPGSPDITTADRLALIHQVAPDFPATWVQKLRKGSVEVQFDVGPEGLVTAASALRSSHRRLEAAAIDAVKAWRFAPPGATLNAVVELGFDLDR